MIGKPAALFSVPTYCERGLGNSNNTVVKPCPDGGTARGDFSDIKLVSTAVTGSLTQPNTPGTDPIGSAAMHGQLSPQDVPISVGLSRFQHVSPAEHRVGRVHF